MPRLLLIRHSEDEADVCSLKSEMTHDHQIHLTSKGRCQAEEIGDWIAKRLPSALVLTSESPRSLEAATIIANKLGRLPVREKLLAQRFAPSLSGLERGEYLVQQEKAHLEPTRARAGDETPLQHYVRCWTWLAGFLAECEEHTVCVVVSHGLTIENIQTALLGAPPFSKQLAFSLCVPGHIHYWTATRQGDGYLWMLSGANYSASMLDSIFEVSGPISSPDELAGNTTPPESVSSESAGVGVADIDYATKQLPSDPEIQSIPGHAYYVR